MTNRPYTRIALALLLCPLLLLRAGSDVRAGEQTIPVNIAPGQAVDSVFEEIPQIANDKEDAIIQDDMRIIRDRLIQPLLHRNVNDESVKRLLADMNPDGSWNNIDYRDKSRSIWKARQHLGNLRTLVLAYKSPKSPRRNDAELKRAISASLDYWLENDFQNPNWWNNEIGVPQQLGPILLLLDDELTVDERSKGIKILERGKIGRTGQNLVWLAEITMIRGIITRNRNIVNEALRRISDEIKITTQEGIQPDQSFHQHGECLYNHGYGAGFAVDCSRLAGLALGTQFAFPAERIDILTNYVLDGSQWMTYGSVEDYGADGREITRPGQTADYLRQAATNLLSLSTGRAEELERLKARLVNPKASPLEGNRHFWRSDIMTHLRNGYYTSARMYSTRIYNTDMPCNGEGLMSHHVADGCNFLFVSGDEYQDIFPVWDWRKIPGTTVEQNRALEDTPRRRGTTDFVGGVSDGRYGMAVFELERDTLTAHKAWFFFDNEYVCLGAGITCLSQNPVLTTVNQCHLRGDVTTFAASEERRLPRGEHRLASPIGVHHSNVAYIFNSGAELLLQNTLQEGSRHAINHSYPNDKISHDLFTLCIDHGIGPQDAAYSYIVCPGMDVQQARDYAKVPGVAVLSNTKDIQAVKSLKVDLSQIAFFAPGRLEIDEETTVGADKPCLLMVHHSAEGTRLSLSDPTQKLKTINVDISGELRGDGCRFDHEKKVTTLSFQLPLGGHAGQSVVRLFSSVDTLR